MCVTGTGGFPSLCLSFIAHWLAYLNSQLESVLSRQLTSRQFYMLIWPKSLRQKPPTHALIIGVFGPNSSRNYLRGNVHWGVPGEQNTFRSFFSFGIRTTYRSLLRKLRKLAGSWYTNVTSTRLKIVSFVCLQLQQMKASTLPLHAFV